MPTGEWGLNVRIRLRHVTLLVDQGGNYSSLGISYELVAANTGKVLATRAWTPNISAAARSQLQAMISRIVTDLVAYETVPQYTPAPGSSVLPTGSPGQPGP